MHSRRQLLQQASDGFGYLAFAVLATLVPALGLGLLTYWRHQALVDDSLSAELRTLGSHAHGELSQWIAERVEDVRTVSGASTVLEGLSAAAGSTPGTRPFAGWQIEAYLRAVQGRLGSLLELGAFDADGTLVASTAPLPMVTPDRMVDPCPSHSSCPICSSPRVAGCP